MRYVVVAATLLFLSVALMADDLAKVYVYARRDTAARTWLSISCDNLVVAELKQGAFFAIEIAPGRHAFLLENGIPLVLDAQTGQDSFVRLDWSYGIDRPPIPVLTKVLQPEARVEMKYLSYVNAKRVHSSLVPRTDPSPLYQPQLRTR
jgi:hypothetical protein